MPRLTRRDPRWRIGLVLCLSQVAKPVDFAYAILSAARTATSTAGGRGSVRAAIGTRLAQRLALPGCLKSARPRDKGNDTVGW